MGKNAIHDFEVLVLRCRSGDPDSWHRLIAKFRALVRRIAARTDLTHEEAEDAFQHTSLVLVEALPKIRSARALPKWIATTAVRECLKVRRSRPSHQPVEVLREVASIAPSPEDLAIEEAVEAELRGALGRLPPHEMTLLHQLFLSDLTYEEVVGQGQMPVGSIGPTRSRALARLRDFLVGTGRTAGMSGWR